MSNNIQTQRKVKLVTVERANAWVVLAFITEVQNGETVIVSQPKVVKVILKNTLALETSKNKKQIALALPAPISLGKEFLTSVVSPFFSTIFGFSNNDFVIGLAARPPTVS